LPSAPSCSKKPGSKNPRTGRARAFYCGWRGGRSGSPGSPPTRSVSSPRRWRWRSAGWRWCKPLLVSTVVFALPLGARFTGQRIRRLDVIAAALVVGALIAFLTISEPSGGHDDAPLDQWLIAIGACAVVCVPLVVLGRFGSAPRRAALLGTATGVLFALSAALTKVVADEVDDGLFEIFVDWHLYALIAVGYASMTLNQLALNTGALAPAVATSLAFDPIASVILGVTLLDESLHTTPLEAVGTALALAVALAGMAILARSQAQAEQPAALRT
jgi:drug/metabolite transporter (DMT)-like permease